MADGSIPEACSNATSPILLVAHQSSSKIILDPAKRHECLFHGFFSACELYVPNFKLASQKRTTETIASIISTVVPELLEY